MDEKLLSCILSVNVCTWYSLDSLFRMLLCVADAVRVFPACINGDKGVSAAVGQPPRSPLLPHAVAGGRAAVEGMRGGLCGCYYGGRGVAVCVGVGVPVGERGLLCVQVFEGVATDSIH